MPVDTHEEDRQMSTPGQSKLDNPAYCELARDYCLVGATNEVLADFFGVTRRTIQNWMATHRDFADAVREGRVAADAKSAARCSSAPPPTPIGSGIRWTTGRRARPSPRPSWKPSSTARRPRP